MRFLLLLLLTISAVSALNGFSDMKDYSKNGFGVPGDVWMMTPQVDRVFGSPDGLQSVSLMDINKGLFLPDSYTINARGLVELTHQIGTLTNMALAVESMRPRSSTYTITDASMPTVPQRSNIMPFRPQTVKQIDMSNRGGRYSYEGQYDLSRQWIIAWKNTPPFN